MLETELVVKIEKPVNDTIATANAIVVKDTETRLAAAEYLKVVKGMQKEVSDTFDPIVSAAKATHTEACNQRSKYLEPLKIAEAALKAKAIAYDEELARIECEKQAELDRKAKAEEERKQKDLLARAEKAAASGKTEKAEELKQQAAEVHVVAPQVQSQAVKVTGQSSSDSWYAEVVDFKALPNEYKLPNQSMLDKFAKATKGAITVPGVVFKSKKILSSRSA